MADNTRHSTLLPTVAVLMVVGLAVYITWFIAPHFEDHFAMYKMIVYETNTGLTKNFHYINDIMGWETLLGKLQLAYPAISWWSVAVGGTVLLCSMCMAFMLGRAAAQNRLPLSLWLMLMTLILIFTGWNVFWLHHNRAAFAMASVGVLGSLLQSGSHGFYYTLKRIGWVAVFAAGICWRFEAGVAAFVLLAPLCFLSTPFRWSSIRAKVGLHTLTVLGFIAVYLFKTTVQPDFYYSIEPEVEYELMNRRNTVPLSQMQTAQDSIRYSAVNEYWMLGDVEQTSAAFMRSLIPKPEGFFHRFFFFLHQSRSSSPTISYTEAVAQYGIVLINFLVLMWLMWSKRQKWVALFLTAYILFAVLLLSVSFRVEGLQRVTQPFLQLLVMAICLVTVVSYRAGTSRFWTVLSVLVTVLNLNYLHSELKMMDEISTNLKKTEAHIREQTAQYIDRSARPYVLPFMDFTIFNTGVFTPYNGFNGKQLLFFEYGQFSASPNFLATISRATGCKELDFKCRLQFLQNHRKEFIVIGTEQRLAFIEEYAQKMYKLPLTLRTTQRQHLIGNTYLWLP